MKRAYTLIEALIVSVIFALLFGAVIMVLISSDKSWRLGQNKLTEQQEARKAMDEITKLLRQSNPDWQIGASHYQVTISSNSTLEFYQPVFDATGDITTLKKITFRLNPNNLRQLLKKEGSSDEVIVAGDIESLNFGGGCAGCSAYNCTTVASDCPMVKIDISTKKRQVVEFNRQPFNLTSRVTLRNNPEALPTDTETDEGGT